ncbi:MAG: type II secretion system F family protein [Candidatus Altiarchaeota archaeon]|nr:type II secretion system F family protein [Candidatus Altiarchaeota archaeon]
MTSPFDSEKLQDSSKVLSSPAKKLLLIFPDLEWNLKRSGYTMGAVQYLAIVLFVTITAFLGTLFLTTTPFLLTHTELNPYMAAGLPIFVALFAFFYFIYMPKMTVLRESRLIDKDLEYMLKDMQIQMTAGVPLFNTIANIAAGGYGECSKLMNEIVQQVESGSSMRDVLNNYGMLSPSEYMRRALWQIANAMQTGSDIKIALIALSNDIRQEKENKIKVYGQELTLWGLIYMMMVIVAPSMGVTLLVVLSSFVGSRMINMDIFWGVLFGVVAFQIMFISLIRSKRPNVG